MTVDRFHLAWFLQGSSVQAWSEPWTGNISEEWMSADMFLDLARSLEQVGRADEEIGEVHVPETHLISSAFEAIHGERRELEIFGTDYPTPDGTCIRDYIHVNDLAEAHVLGVEYLENGSSTALNLGTGQGSSVREVISTIERITSRPLPQRVAPRREGDPPQLVADPSLAQKVLGWKARRSLHDIVATAWKWDQSHRKSMAPTL